MIPEDFSIDQWYAQHYNDINATAVSGSVFSRVMHTSLERSAPRRAGQRILEIGSNTGEHLPFVDPSTFANGSYVATDIRTPSADDLDRIAQFGAEFAVADAQALPFDDSSFDRVISTCVFHHLDSPDEAFNEVRRVLAPGGVFSLLLPNDPGLTYRVLRRVTTGRRAKQRGLFEQESLVHAIEHRNGFLQLLALLRWSFRTDDIKLRGYPFGLSIYDLNAFTVVTVTKGAP